MITSHIYNKKEVIEKQTMCQVINGHYTYFTSPDCKEKKCKLFSSTKESFKDFKAFSQIGSPGFRLCRQLGGVGQIITVTKGKNKIETERCLDGKSFVEISFLIEHYKKFF